MAAKRDACLTMKLRGVPCTSNRLGKAVNERRFLGRGLVHAGTKRKTDVSVEGESQRAVLEDRHDGEGQ